jgi:glycosyltransferase involved in cell wall biosynthesis
MHSDKKSIFDKLEQRYESYRAAIDINNKIKEWNIDIVHTNSSVIEVGALAAALSGIPHIWHIREFGEEDYGLNFDRGIEKATHFMEHHSEYIITITNSLKNKYKDLISDSKLVRIYNGVDINEIKLSQYPKSLEKINFLLVGLLHENKGQEEAIRAIEVLVKQEVKNVHLYLAGDGPYKTEIEKMIKHKKLDEYITFLGHLNDLTDIRSKCHVALMCSRAEAFGLVTVEAMMAGMPVIGAASGGTVEIIKDGVTGLLYIPKDEKSLSEKMMHFIQNPDDIKKMGLEGYKRAKKLFTSEKNAEEIIKLYNQVLKTGSKL